MALAYFLESSTLFQTPFPLVLYSFPKGCAYLFQYLSSRAKDALIAEHGAANL